MSDSASPDYHGLWSNLTTDALDADIGILGIPFDNATSFRKGAAWGPARIRDLTPFIAPSTEEGRWINNIRVRDYGDVKPDLHWERYFSTVEQATAQALAHPFSICLGGDHSVTIPLQAAFSKAVEGRIGIIQFDAHLDLADEFAGHRWSHACTARRAMELDNASPSKLAFFGTRSYMHDELDYLKDNREVEIQTARQVAVHGAQVAAKKVIDALRGVKAVYFTLDIDGLDPAYAPGTGTPEAGGVSMRDLLHFIQMIFDELPIRAMDIVEVAPPLDHNDITSLAAIRVIYEVFGILAARKT
jgi:agmatinase